MLQLTSSILRAEYAKFSSSTERFGQYIHNNFLNVPIDVYYMHNDHEAYTKVLAALEWRPYDQV